MVETPLTRRGPLGSVAVCRTDTRKDAAIIQSIFKGGIEKPHLLPLSQKIHLLLSLHLNLLLHLGERGSPQLHSACSGFSDDMWV